MTGTVVAADPFEPRRAVRATGLLGAFNAAGVLHAADVHVALRLSELCGEADESVALALALAVRAPRIGHVVADLGRVRETAIVETEDPVDLDALPWPDVAPWLERVAASPLVAAGEHVADAARPLRLAGRLLYLDRYWREERRLAADLDAFAAVEAAGVRVELLADGLARLFDGDPLDRQRLAAATAVLRRLAVVAGGPGTGKTTTVARIAALLCEQARAAGDPPPLIALAAPTGKAAARLEEAVREEAGALRVDPEVRAHVLALGASTLHRLLGARPGTSRLRHHRGNRLPHDVVVVDETSMVSLSQMARLVEAVRSDARLVLVGDPGQLRSIEAGAVLGDIVGPAADGLRMRGAARERLSAATGGAVVAAEAAAQAAVADGIVVLERVHRFGHGIARVAEAIRRGDADAVQAALRAAEDVEYVALDPADPAAPDALAPVREAAVGASRAVMEAARSGRPLDALAALGAFRLLCAHRRGTYGVSAWTQRIERWLADAIPGFAPGDEWYVGRPLLVTENDYSLRLFNGDTGVVVPAADGRPAGAFERGGSVLEVGATRLASVETVYAMTIHKSQGSQFDTAAVLLPDPTSPLLTRELLYTAVTRARRRLILAATEETIRAAVERPAARASGLRARLWGDAG